MYTCNACWFYVVATCKRLFEPFVLFFNKLKNKSCHLVLYSPLH